MAASPDPHDESAKRRLGTDARRAQLIELGLGLFGARPYDEVSIDDIALTAGISKGLLYHYFGGKREFYVACLSEASERLIEAVRPPAELAPAERVRVGVERYLTFVEARAVPVQALLRGGLGTDPEVAAIIDSVRQAIFGMFVEGLGLGPPRPVYRTLLVGWIGFAEAASLDWLAHRDQSRDELAGMLVAMLKAQVLAAAQLDPAGARDLVGGLAKERWRGWWGE